MDLELQISKIWSMSEVGQSRHFGCVPVTSGLHPTTDMSLRRNNWRYVPKAVIRPCGNLIPVPDPISQAAIIAAPASFAPANFWLSNANHCIYCILFWHGDCEDFKSRGGLARPAASDRNVRYR
jgi:hypothetical protein